MSSRKPDPAVELAQRMLEVFDSRRSFENAEPPTLQQLQPQIVEELQREAIQKYQQQLLAGAKVTQ